jgi:hypothetical protein
MNLLQQEPSPETALSVSGFLAESNAALTGSVEVPPVAAHENCGGIASVTGTVNGQTVTLVFNEGGTTLSLNGTISSDNTTMSGNYEGLGGGCFTTATTGTWNALLIPPLTGNFTGTITNSSYMTLLTGESPPAPIAVSGTISQTINSVGSSATLTGTITANNYPCFSTASLTGTISGQSVYLDLIGYNGLQIGTLGQPGTVGTAGSPATVVVNSGKISLVDTSITGLFLGAFNGISATGPCPALLVGSGTQTFDSGSVAFNFQ